MATKAALNTTIFLIDFMAIIEPPYAKPIRSRRKPGHDEARERRISQRHPKRRARRLAAPAKS